MSGQLEWLICFMCGVFFAWATLRAFGVLVLVLAVGFTARAETFTMTNLTKNIMQWNGCGVCKVFDPVSGNQVVGCFNGGWGTVCASGQILIMPGEASTVAYDASITCDGCPPISDTLLYMQKQETTAQQLVMTVRSDNSAHHYGWFEGSFNGQSDQFFANMDGKWAGGMNPHPSVTVTMQDSFSIPWIPTDPGSNGPGVLTNDVLVVLSNGYGGFSWGTNFNSKARDLEANQDIQDAAVSIGHMISAEATNQWNTESPLWTNLTTSDAGPRTLFNADVWTITHGPAWMGGYMTNAVSINADPHQWQYYYRCANVSLLAWTWIIVVGCILCLKDWIEDATDRGYLIPPQKSLASAGGFIQGLVTSATFGGIMLVIPIALDAVIGHFLGLQPSTSLISFWTEDGSTFSLYTRYGWYFINEWVPMDLFINACFYMLLVRFQFLRGVKATQYLLIRLTTCVVIWLCFNSFSARASVDVQWSGSLEPSATSTPSGSYLVINSSLGHAETFNADLPFRVSVPDNVFNINGSGAAASWAVNLNFNPALSNVVLTVDQSGNYEYFRKPYSETRADVDGVQALVEGYGMIVPFGTLAWVRKFRRWGQSGGQRIDL